jgi:CRP/FNR family cyclic AMP-dependent transcriptional regulator
MENATGHRELRRMLDRSWARPTAKDRADALGELPLFAGVSKRHLRKIAALAQTEEFSAGDIVIQVGEASDAFYLILGGRARIIGKSRNSLRIGDYFGEMGLLDGEPRSATVAAADQLHVMKLSRRPFMALLSREPQIAMAMLATLAGRVRKLEQRASH